MSKLNQIHAKNSLWTNRQTMSLENYLFDMHAWQIVGVSSLPKILVWKPPNHRVLFSNQVASHSQDFIMFHYVLPFFLVSCYQCEVHQSFDYLPKGDSPSSLPPLSHEAASPILSHLPFSEKRRYLATQINYFCL